jgi:oxalate decarboxylase/phosphoglucose isomerase-like protein (cupin superfamily)
MSDMIGDRPDLEAGDKKYVRPPAYYETWQKGEGIPIHKVFHVEDMMDVELGQWERFGVPAAFVNLADPFITTAMIIEIPPGGKSKPVRHMFETWNFVVDGHGETIIEQDDAPANTVAWQPRSLFGPPLNTVYQHVNKDPDRPARILMVTNAPLTMNLYHNDEFVFENDFVFDDRYTGENSFFNGESEYLGGRVTKINLIKDTLDFQLLQWKFRGHGAKSFHMSMSGHTMACHLSEFAVGTYKKCHRHGPGAHVIILAGQGYSLLWKEGDEPTRVNWKPNSIFAPPDQWFHQHFNTGPEPARYLALRRGGSPEHPIKLGASGGADAPDQIEYEDEDPWIYDSYEADLKKNGVEIGQPRPEYRNKG